MNAIRRFSSFLALLFFAPLLLTVSASFASIAAQTPDDFDDKLKQSIQLINENKFADALPILEKLNVRKPDDPAVLEGLAYALSVTAITEKDAATRKKNLARAHALAKRSQELGNDSQLVKLLIEKIPADGEMETLTAAKERTPAEEALLEGETAFAKGELERAIEAYERAAKLNPKMYEAPLFIGDAYYKMNKIDKAGEAYARAIAINPDRETAYRYWGNVLMRNGKNTEARDKFIEAIIADPYNRAPWQFLTTWAQRNQVELGHPRIQIPRSSVQRKDDNNISIFDNPSDKDDGANAWMIYSLMKAGWITGENFKKAFPNEKDYRHSLPEEAGALRLAAESVVNQLKDGNLKEKSLDVSIANLLKLHRAGLIEPFVLLAIPDEGIARDYEAYRKANRAKLRQYLLEYVVANK
jgi:tetratricopeptide (TPR) repeat protein